MTTHTLIHTNVLMTLRSLTFLHKSYSLACGKEEEEEVECCSPKEPCRPALFFWGFLSELKSAISCKKRREGKEEKTLSGIEWLH